MPPITTPRLADTIRGFAMKLGAAPEAVADLGALDQAILDQMWQVVVDDRKLRWSIVQRGFWVQGVDNFRDFLHASEAYTLDGRAEHITCPTLVTAAEDDPLAAGAQPLFDALRCPKHFIRFTAEEGAGDHCEMMNRSLLNRRVLDWLDGVVGTE